MRTLGLIFLSTVVPATAFASFGGDSVAEDIEFHSETRVFNGTEAAADLVSFWDFAIGISLDVTSNLTLDMNANSEVSWPTALTHTWEGVTKGGSANLDASAVVGLYLRDTSGSGSFNLTLPAMTVQFESGAVKFDTIPLPGGQNSIIVRIPTTEEIVGLQYTFEDALSAFGVYDVNLTLGIDLVPDAAVMVAGTQVKANDITIETNNGSGVLELPSQHDGLLPIEAVWEGVASGTFDFQVRGLLGVDTDANGTDEFSLAIPVYTIPFSTDEVKIKSDVSEFDHELPAIGIASQLDMGTVEVGQSVQVDLPVQNVGLLDLEGEGLYEGDAAIRIANDNDFYVDPNGAEVLTLVFEPEAEGNFTGTLTFETNDPMMPEVQVPVFGTGTSPAVDPGDGPGDGDGDGDLQTRGCGCNSTPAAPTGLIGLALAGLLIRRRRRS